MFRIVFFMCPLNKDIVSFFSYIVFLKRLQNKDIVTFLSMFFTEFSYVQSIRFYTIINIIRFIYM